MTPLQPLGDRSAPAADLHLHSRCSDGLLTPTEAMEAAAAANVRHVALTDHDTFAGLEEAGRRARELGLELIPGVEISCNLPEGGERHVLAYGADPEHPGLRDGLARNRAERDRRVDRTLEALATAGVHLTREQIAATAEGASVGRPHVADALVRAGRVKSRQEAFDRWLGDGKIGHVPRMNIGVAEAIRLVHEAGGVTVLAHPGRRPRPGVIEALLALGLDGLEVLHPANGPEDVKMLNALVERHGLLATGGSDNHGDADGMAALRARRVPARVAEALLERLRTRAARSGRGSTGA